MIALWKANERGHFDRDWLNSYHTFSFGDFYHPDRLGFRALRVINDDRIRGGGGFGDHPHRNMEIVTYILEGALQHGDSLGQGGVLRPGDVQAMTAGSGIVHHELNPSPTETVHLLQIWLLPKEPQLPPAYSQKHFPVDERRNRWCLLASEDGRESSLVVHQDVRLFASLLDQGTELPFESRRGRGGWLQVARGRIQVNGQPLTEGDALALSGEEELTITALQPSELLSFDLP